MSKKLISLTLSVIMMFFFVSVMAEETQSDFSTIIKYGIMQTDQSCSLNLEKDITRGDMAQFVMNALGLGTLEYTGVEEAFSDVPKDHASYNAVMQARSLGIVEGNGDGTYAPDRRISYAEALKMIVIALGYDPLAQSRGAWQLGYLTVANTLGLTEGINSVTDDYVPARHIAAMLENAMNAPIMAQTGFGSQNEYTILDGSAGTELVTLKDNLE